MMLFVLSYSNNNLMNLLMGKVKQIEIKNLKVFQKTYYFHNNIFDSNLLKIDKKSYKDVDIYHIAYITIKNDCENIYSAKSFVSDNS